MASPFTSGDPLIQHTASGLMVSLPIINVGLPLTSNVWITSIELGSPTLPRLSPKDLPLFLGDLVGNNFSYVHARFGLPQVFTLSFYWLTVGGTYEAGGATFRFSLRKQIDVPVSARMAVPLLKADVAVSVQNGTWTYQIFNQSIVVNQQFISSFALDIVVPVTVTGIPRGWHVYSDNSTYVLWFSDNRNAQIEPQLSLGGFQISSPRPRSESTKFIVTAWDYKTRDVGLMFPDRTLTPSRL